MRSAAIVAVAAGIIVGCSSSSSECDIAGTYMVTVEPHASGCRPLPQAVEIQRVTSECHGTPASSGGPLHNDGCGAPAADYLVTFSGDTGFCVAHATGACGLKATCRPTTGVTTATHEWTFSSDGFSGSTVETDAAGCTATYQLQARR